GAVGKDVARGPSVRHDHGSRQMSADFQTEIRFLGAKSCPAFVRAPEGDGCAERFIRTLKETLLGVRRFDTIEDLRNVLLAVQRTHDERWQIERHGHRPPTAIRRERTIDIQTAA
ncbi:MAG: IS3 family transposase, partial [Paracoccaceae bacterium]